MQSDRLTTILLSWNFGHECVKKEMSHRLTGRYELTPINRVAMGTSSSLFLDI